MSSFKKEQKKKVVKGEVDVAFITDWNLSESSKYATD